LLFLATVYPYITEEYKNFDNFLLLDKNKKAKFFIDFVEKETAKRIMNKSDSNYYKVKNRVLRIMWGVQGFLGHLSSETDLRANHKFLENFTPIPSLQLKITMSDVYELYDEMPSKGRRRLEMQTLTGWNNIDLVDLRLDDFQATTDNNFLFIAKSRHKTRGQKVYYLNIVDHKTYWRYEKYCNRYDIKSNEPIFKVTPQAISAYYRFHIDKNPYFNKFIMPRNIRQLTFTLLRPIFQTQPELFNLYTQHSTTILTKHYIKDSTERLIELYPEIEKRVLLDSFNPYALELKEIKKDLKTDVEQLIEKTELISKKVNSLEQKDKYQNEIKNIIKDTVKETLKEIKE
jgi:hypothetical protein